MVGSSQIRQRRWFFVREIDIAEDCGFEEVSECQCQHCIISDTLACGHWGFTLNNGKGTAASAQQNAADYI